MANEQKQFQAIPQPTIDPASMLKTLLAIKENIEVLTGMKPKVPGLGELLRDIQSISEGRNARFTEYVEVSTANDAALATRTTTLEAETAENSAKITEVETAYADADNALASRIDTVEAASNDNTARITSVETAYADADSALSTRIDMISATAGGGTANGRISFVASAGPAGWNAAYTLTVNANGPGTATAGAGFAVLAGADINGNLTSAVVLTAAQFRLVDPTSASALPVFNYMDGVFQFNVPVRILGQQLEENAVTNTQFQINNAADAQVVSTPIETRAGAFVDLDGEFDGQPTVGFPLSQVPTLLRLQRVTDGQITILRDKRICFYVVTGSNNQNTVYYTYTGTKFRDNPPPGTHSYQIITVNGPSQGPLALRATELFR